MPLKSVKYSTFQIKLWTIYNKKLKTFSEQQLMGERWTKDQTKQRWPFRVHVHVQSLKHFTCPIELWAAMNELLISVSTLFEPWTEFDERLVSER